jgi:hypothetical protein
MSNKKLSLIISIIYVGLGTIYGLLYWTGIFINLNDTLFDFLMAFFIPSSFISIIIIFTVENPVLLILFAQILSFFICWAIIYGVVSLLRKPNKMINSDDDLHHHDDWK